MSDRILDEVPAIEPEQENEFRETVLAFLDNAKRIDPKWSQARLSSMADVSTAVLSGLLKGNYTGSGKGAFVKQILAVVDREKSNFNAQIKRPTFVNTKLSAQMNYLMNTAQADTSIVVFTGDAGIGKTESLRGYVRENRYSIFIEADFTYSVTTVLEKIAGRLGIGERGRKDRMMDAIVHTLSGTNRMIIVDEAEYLPVKSLDILRRIYDKADIPLTLCGMPRLYSNILGAREQMAQISSRMDHYRLQKLDRDDVRAIIETVIDNPSGELVDRFFENSNSGNARALTKLLMLTQRTAIYNHCAITPAVVIKARESLIA